MMKFLRSQSQTVLWVVLGVIALGFLFYGNAGQLLTSQSARGNNDFGRIDGQDLTAAQLYDAIRDRRNMLIMQGRSQALNQPGARKQLAEDAWLQLLLLHEADRLHIEVTTQQLVDLIHNTPAFQKDGVYSPEVYQSKMIEMQNSLHISPEAFEDILRDGLRIEAVSKALFSTIRASAYDVSAQYEKYYGPAQVSVITFDPKTFVDSAQVTPEEIEAEYKAHPDNPDYRTKEKRKVDYVLFQLTPDQAKLSPDDKKAAMEALGQKALEFVLSFQPAPTADGTTPPAPDFQAEVKARGLTAGTTNFFTVDTPPANVPPSPSFNNAAFSLTKEEPVSKVIEIDNAVVVLHLADTQPSELKPLDAVKADIAKQLQQTKGNQAETLAVQNATQALQAALAKGGDFKAVAAALNLKVTTTPAFVPLKVLKDQSTDQTLQTIAYATAGMTVGQLTPPIPVQSNNTTLILHLDSRGKADPASMAEFETQFRGSADQQLRGLVSQDWAEWQSKQPGTHKPPDLDAYGSVE